MNKVVVAMVLGFLMGHSAAPWAATPARDGVELVIGNEVWQPGKRYRDGSDWLALTCTGVVCGFEPAKLAVRSRSWRGHYDDKPTAGQKLTFSKMTRTRGKVIAWFRVDAKRNWLVPGSVTTYATSGARLKRPPTEGTLEVAIDLPDGEETRFVPLLDQSKKAFYLQLRAKGQRQLLGELGTCSKTVSTNYFLWAGDLDRDGKPDYLVSFVDEDGEVILYLSGAAQAGETVGIAGVYAAPPFGGECDGGGWLGF